MKVCQMLKQNGVIGVSSALRSSRQAAAFPGLKHSFISMDRLNVLSIQAKLVPIPVLIGREARYTIRQPCHT